MNAAILIYHDVLELDVAGPHTVLRTAARYAPEPLEVFTIAKSRASIVASGGLVITPNYAFTAGAPEPDVLIVPGGPGAEKAGRDHATRAYLREQARRVPYLAGVCTGALTLGEAGLLENLVATTFHASLEQLWTYNPADVVDARVVRNANGRYFSGGVTAGIDLALDLVHDAFGPEVARATAAHVNYSHWTPVNS